MRVLAILLAIVIVLATVGPARADTYPPNTTAASGGKQPAIITAGESNYRVYYSVFDIDRMSSWAHTVAPGHRGSLNLHITTLGVCGATHVKVSDITPNGYPISFDDPDQPMSSDMCFTFKIAAGASYPTVVAVTFDIELFDVWVCTRCITYTVVDINADLQAPLANVLMGSTPSSVNPGDEFSVTFTLRNTGADDAFYGAAWWGNGLQLYLENGEFTRPPLLSGFQGYVAYDRNNTAGRSIAGAPILELYDDYVFSGGSDTATVYMKATGLPGAYLNIKYSAWMTDDDEKVYNTQKSGTEKTEKVFFRSSLGSPPLPFNGEWGGTPNFDDTAAGSTPIAQIQIACTAPPAPSLASPSNGQTGLSTTPTLDWSDVSGATSYDVQVCTDSGCSNVVGSYSPSSSQWTVSPALGEGTQYYWRARARNACGSGSWSSVWSFTTAANPINRSGTPAWLWTAMGSAVAAFAAYLLWRRRR